MKNLHLWGALGLTVVLVSCHAQTSLQDSGGPEGGVRISLSQADILVSTKAEDPDVPLPSLDDFDVEIYNANAIRLYRQYYSEAKTQTIKLNAGDYTLVAQHGDSLGAGFGKPYYLADEAFTVHGYVENGGEPDYVSATAKLANVRLAVEYGEKIQQFYSNYYVVVRHSGYPKKQVKFVKDETRFGYIPGGNLYLEVYAYLGGTTDKAGEDRWVYYKSEPAEYLPNDFVTFKVDAPGREGDITVTINVDRSVETIEIEEVLGAEALPAAPPSFSFKEDVTGDYSYGYPAGFVESVSDAVLTLNISPSVKFESVTLHTQSSAVSLEDMDLQALSDTQKEALEAYGIRYLLPEDYPMGYIDFSGAVRYVSDNAPFTADTPSATFTVTVTDTEYNTSSAVFRLQPTPVDATVSVADTDIWGWKFVSPKAVLKDVDHIPAGTVIGLQYSSDGSTWSSEIASTAVDGVNLTFGDATGLTAGTTYLLRTIVNHDPTNVSSPTSIRTEDGLQVGNSGFEEYTQLSYTTKGITGSITTDWWQLYTDSASAWWAVNSECSLNSDRISTGSSWVVHAEYASYPTVMVTNSQPSSGSSSLIVASVKTGNAATLTDVGLVGVKEYYGEVFLGTSNGEHKDNWAALTKGHAFSSRPSALSFMHKFNPVDSTPYYVCVQILDSDDNVIGQAEKNNATSSVNSWTKVTMPVTYTVTNRKAASIRIDFRSSKDGDEDTRSITVTTLSGSHKFMAGNILYLDNIELLYK